MALPCKLFVGNLPATCTQDQLASLMVHCGQIKNVHMMTRPTASGSICAFVEFASHDSAKLAIETFDHKLTIPPHASAMTVSFAQSQIPKSVLMTGGGPTPAVVQELQMGGANEAKLFVGNLPSDISESDIQATFSPFGPVTKVVIINKPSSTGNRSAFVMYTDLDACNKAILALNNSFTFPGCTNSIVVRFADSAKGTANNKESQGAPNDVKLFVGNLPQTCTAAQLTEIMAPYGQITHMHMMTNPTSTGAICAFVEYATNEQALAAISGLNGLYTVPPREGPMTVQFAKNKGSGKGGTAGLLGGAQALAQLGNISGLSGLLNNAILAASGVLSRSGTGGSGGGGGNGPANPAGSNPNEVKLFVGNLPLTMTPEALREMFLPFGNLVEAFLFKRGTDTARGAFVRFSDPASAQQAINTLNGMELLGQRMLVQPARPSNPSNPSAGGQILSSANNSSATAAAALLNQAQQQRQLQLASSGGLGGGGLSSSSLSGNHQPNNLQQYANYISALSGGGGGSASSSSSGGLGLGGLGLGGDGGIGNGGGLAGLSGLSGALGALGTHSGSALSALSGLSSGNQNAMAGFRNSSQLQQQQQQPPQDTIMTVYNLPGNYTEASVTAMFSVFGAVNRVAMTAEDPPGVAGIEPTCARATVHFAEPETARMAQQTMNNFQVGAHKLRCILKLPPQQQQLLQGHRPY